MASSDHVRVSDQERDQVAQQLRDHFAAGRLSDEELSERVDSAYAARTERELRDLVADLPKLPASPAEQKAELVARRRHLQRRLIQQTGGGMAAFFICVAIWATSGAQGQFWPIWVLLVVAIPLLRNGWRLYGPAPELDRVERELEAKEELRGRHRRRAELEAGDRVRGRERHYRGRY